MERGMTKVCSKCGDEKPLGEFSIRKGKTEAGKHRNECRMCVSAYKKEYHKKYNDKNRDRRKKIYLDNKEEILKKNKAYRVANSEQLNKRRANRREKFNESVYDYYGGACAICGESEKFYEIYDGHHLNPHEKEVGISKLVTSDWDTVVIPELEKCVYLCSNCHKKLHNHRFDEKIKSGELILTPGRVL